MICSLGEMTFLQLSTLYPTNIALGAFSTGTGFSGLISALIYNIVTSVLQIDVRRDLHVSARVLML